MSEIFKIVKDKKQGYTVVPNQLLFDENISLKSTMLLAIMLALPPTWDLTLKGLATLKKDGLDSIRTGMNELEKAGYIVKKRVRNELGQVKGTEYTVYETLDLNPDIDKTCSDSKKSSKNHANTRKTPKLENPIQDETEKNIKPKLENPIQAKTAKNVMPKLDFPIQANPTQSNTKLIKNNYIKSINQDNINNNINNNTYRCDDLDSIDKIDKKILKEKIKKQISYEKLVGETDRNQTDSIVEILSDVMSSRKKQIRIAKEDKPIEDVRERFLSLTYEHICYVIKSVSSQASKPRNIKAYLLTALYNAPATMAFSSSGSDGKARERPEKQYSFDLKDIKSLVNNFSDTEDENPTANSKSCSTSP